MRAELVYADADALAVRAVIEWGPAGEALASFEWSIKSAPGALSASAGGCATRGGRGRGDGGRDCVPCRRTAAGLHPSARLGLGPRRHPSRGATPQQSLSTQGGGLGLRGWTSLGPCRRPAACALRRLRRQRCWNQSACNAAGGSRPALHCSSASPPSLASAPTMQRRRRQRRWRVGVGRASRGPPLGGGLVRSAAAVWTRGTAGYGAGRGRQRCFRSGRHAQHLRRRRHRRRRQRWQWCGRRGYATRGARGWPGGFGSIRADSPTTPLR